MWHFAVSGVLTSKAVLGVVVEYERYGDFSRLWPAPHEAIGYSLYNKSLDDFFLDFWGINRFLFQYCVGKCIQITSGNADADAKDLNMKVVSVWSFKNNLNEVNKIVF